ncbi:tyrosine phosphatase family-domain-containing protein [Xylariaceae sp. FL1272]|nr:tyrosine phosphatase family-domain-containing protein [Xylariaceae sp. FL1272]
MEPWNEKSLLLGEMTDEKPTRTEEKKVQRVMGTPNNSLSLCRQPPVNFSQVNPGLYRSGYPVTADYPFIETLKLKTIVTLVSKDLPDGYQEFISANKITHKVFDMAGTKKEEIPAELMRSIMAVVSKEENYPLLIHCNQGKHRTGCVVGVVRKHSGWAAKRIIDEYTHFAEPKVRQTDVQYLTKLELSTLMLAPKATTITGTIGRFCRFALMAAFALFTFYPIGKFRVPPPPSQSKQTL